MQFSKTDHRQTKGSAVAGLLATCLLYGLYQNVMNGNISSLLQAITRF